MSEDKVEQDAVETPVEETTETESAPVETNTDETPKESADTTVEPEKEISKSVPYDRFAEVNTKAKQLAEENETLKSYLQQQAPAVPENSVEFDADTKSAIQAEINSGIVNHKIAEFKTKHGDELDKDEILSIAVEREMRKQSSQGQTIDPNLAYDNAKTSLSKLVQPQVEQAKEEGVKEGQDIAKTKQQLGAVGEPGTQPEIDETKLSAAEYEKLHNIPRANI